MVEIPLSVALSVGLATLLGLAMVASECRELMAEQTESERINWRRQAKDLVTVFAITASFSTLMLWFALSALLEKYQH